jgi:hypothetical protein
MGDEDKASSVIDVDEMKKVPTWVTELTTYITNYIHNDVSGMLMGGGMKKDVFGGFPEAETVGDKHNQYAKNVSGSLRALKDSLAKFSTATTRILEEYESTEARNAANVADILKILGPAGGTGPVPSGDQGGGY